MHWSVIYSFDLKKGSSVNLCKPINGKWICTEGNEQFEYGDIEKGVHRKYIAFLSDTVFKRFLDNTLYPFYVENTAGMIGGMTPGGIDIHSIPAWSLSPDVYDYNVLWQNAYVCPFPDTNDEHDFLFDTTGKDIKEWISKEYIN